MSTNALLDWLEVRRRLSKLEATPITWRDCSPWRFEEGRLRHEAGFFSIVGVRATSSVRGLDGLASPIIDQPEIGILAFLLRETDRGYEWLMQAKAEPGTVQGVQLAPSVQATESNFTRKHGGLATEYLDFVRDPDAGPARLVDLEQSEQGSMFLNKFNRNVAALKHDVQVREHWRWSSSENLRAVLSQDYVLNTDARSVLVSTPWSFISRTGAPFADTSNEWSDRLSDSYTQSTSNVLSMLEDRRAGVHLETVVTPLETLPNCLINDTAIVSTVRTPELRIAPFAVVAPEREVPAWRQPLVSRDPQDATLVCAMREGVLRFFLRFGPELGFKNRIQFAPSLQSDAYEPPSRWLSDSLARRDTLTRSAILQSDEGGRFMRCITRYAVCEIAEAAAQDDAAGVWVTLGDIERLARVRGALTNETRSIVSLLLAWA